MCGIFGTLNYHQDIDDMIPFSGLLHRGPDQQGSMRVDNLKLYHTRLSIQDLSEAGKQPMIYKNLSIVFNGEIYNHLQLREKYQIRAASNSDTLTILMLYERLGMAMLDEFDGMFAFALYDREKKRLFLARDRAGKKPLYVYRHAGTLAFSSELNLLNAIFRPEPDLSALSAYLYLGHHYRKSVPYRGVEELENGHYLQIGTVTLEEKDISWFSMERQYAVSGRLSFGETLDETDRLLNNAVRSRMLTSDLPVGSFLSGGIDSGLVTAMAAAHTPRLKTFTVKMAGGFDESALALQVAQRYGTEHTTIEIEFSDLSNDIEQILANYGEPVSDNSVIPSYYVAREASRHLRVILNGDGADELFGGYRRYVPFRYLDFFKPPGLLSGASKLLDAVLPIAHQKQSNFTYLRRLIAFSAKKDPLQVYASAGADLLNGFEDQFIQPPALDHIAADLARINQSAMSPLSKMLVMDFQSMLFGRLLPKMDIATMAHSLEGRSPFLARDLLTFAPSLCDSAKISGLETKFVLRQLATRYLPENLVGQPKRGFEVPLSDWVDGKLKAVIGDYLTAPAPLYAGLISPQFVYKLMARKIRISDQRRAKILFAIFSMEVWNKKRTMRLANEPQILQS
ncbi:asparagine synthase (glutamine-hydrolyzing) [Pedobacter yulinensis]|uniref:asparagine synthase (glutamine-hydrolyzing) n=1 Tax=Pedobacter yulinensis TaxID=2126353 RepID=A0A2T3HLE8_9SPHI|nr:asparagine synthase (glutamine-hydrolyzing) [Pedobacter yulinensis]PST83249.1 asparagine synthase (glutamine-hydrolyzing) [Pedobacter yulinensis]